MRRLLLVRHAATAATRSFAFPTDEPLDERGRREARGVVLRGTVLCSPARRCRETAIAAGAESLVLDRDLAECDFGSWGGRTLATLPGDDAAAWMTDPDAAPHGGESHRGFAARVARWLDAQAAEHGTATAVTHGGVVKAAVVHALGAPLDAFWRVDVAPLSTTELHAHDGRWTLTRLNDSPPVVTA